MVDPVFHRPELALLRVSKDQVFFKPMMRKLQGKSLVWRAAHGHYAFEEQGLVDLMRDRGLLS